jgi:hypothetical protein
MRVPFRRGWQAAAATAITAAVIATPAPALAQSSSCHIAPPYVACNTATLYPHADHWVKLRVNVPTAGTVTCRVHDAVNGDQVGIVSRHWLLPSWMYEEITISGLYSRYFAVCVNSSQAGNGILRNS